MIAIVDYGMGNLRSVQKAVEQVGGQAIVTAEATVLRKARGVILPGVGAFGDAVRNIAERRLVGPIVCQAAAGTPLLGICLGMQLLFDESEEMGWHRGLGILGGRVVRFPSAVQGTGSDSYRVPHVGWNRLHPCGESGLLAGVADGSYAYFVHSYYVVPDDPAVVLATTDYGLTYASVVGQGRVLGVQFHPEKSQEIGLRILRSFVEMVEGQR